MLSRFGTIVLVSAITVVLSGLLVAGLRQGAPSGGGYAAGELFSGGYGGLVVAKLAAFVLLVLGAWWHRTRVIATRSDAGTRFWRLVAVELFVLATAVGLSVALAHTS